MTRNELKEIIKDVITESNIDLTNNFTLTNLGCKKLETKLCSIIANHVNSSGDGFVSNGVYISLPTFGFRTIKNGKRNDIDVKIVYNLKSYITYLVAKLRKSKDDDLILAASIIDSLDFTQTTNVIDDGKLITVVTNINVAILVKTFVKFIALSKNENNIIGVTISVINVINANPNANEYITNLPPPIIINNAPTIINITHFVIRCSV